MLHRTNSPSRYFLLPSRHDAKRMLRRTAWKPSKREQVSAPLVSNIIALTGISSGTVARLAELRRLQGERSLAGKRDGHDGLRDGGN